MRTQLLTPAKVSVPLRGKGLKANVELLPGVSSEQSFRPLAG